MSTPDWVVISVIHRPEVAPDEEGNARLLTSLQAAGLDTRDEVGDEVAFEVYGWTPDTASLSGRLWTYGADLSGWAERTSGLSEIAEVHIYVENGEDEPLAYDDTWRDGIHAEHRALALVPSTLHEVRRQVDAALVVSDRLAVYTPHTRLLLVDAEELQQLIEALRAAHAHLARTVEQ